MQQTTSADGISDAFFVAGKGLGLIQYSTVYTIGPMFKETRSVTEHLSNKNIFFLNHL